MENNNHGNTAMIMIITAMDQNQALPCFSDFIAYSCGSYGSSCWVLKNTCFGVNVATSQSVHQYVIRCDAYSQQICSNNKLIVTAGTAHFMWLNDTESFPENRTGEEKPLLDIADRLLQDHNFSPMSRSLCGFVPAPNREGIHPWPKASKASFSSINSATRDFFTIWAAYTMIPIQSEVLLVLYSTSDSSIFINTDNSDFSTMSRVICMDLLQRSWSQIP